MAVSTGQRITARAHMGSRSPLPVRTNTNLYQGTMAFSLSGYGTDSIGAGANPFRGIVVDTVINNPGADGAKTAEVYTEGEFELVGSGFTAATAGALIYASDNYTVTTSSANTSKIGRCTEFISSTRIRVKIDVQQA